MTVLFPLRELTIEITKQCPMRCIICSSDGGEKESNELSFIELKQIVDDAITLGVKTIILSGGEPLECNSTLNLIGYIKKKGLTAHLYSSGNLTKDGKTISLSNAVLKNLKTLDIDKIIFSIHGPNQKIHDAITSRKGSFSNLVTSISRAKIIGHKIELHFVPVLPNYRYLPEVVSLATALKIPRISILRFVPQGRGLTNQKILEITNEDVIKLKHIIDTICKNSSIDVRLGAPFNCFHIKCQTHCTAGIDKATIRPDGIVVPCVSMKGIGFSQSLDSIHNVPLKEIWENSTFFEYIRETHKRIEKLPCNTCDYSRECKGGCLTQRLIKTDSIDGVDSFCIMKKNLILKDSGKSEKKEIRGVL
jgi:radical SAM protein with 4Fe4S-binding SPASM domain